MLPPSVFSGLKYVFTEVPPVWLKGSAVSCGGPAAEPSGAGCAQHGAGPHLLPQKEALLLIKPSHLHPVQSGILIQCQGTGKNVILFLLMTYSPTNISVDATSAQNRETFNRKFRWIYLVGLPGTFGLQTPQVKHAVVGGGTPRSRQSACIIAKLQEVKYVTDKKC